MRNCGFIPFFVKKIQDVLIVIFKKLKGLFGVFTMLIFGMGEDIKGMDTPRRAFLRP